MKLLEWVLDISKCQMVNIDEFTFVLDAILTIRQLQGSYSAVVNGCFYFPFVDIEKAIDNVPKRFLFGHWGVYVWMNGLCHGGHTPQSPEACATRWLIQWWVEATFCYLGDMLCSGEGCDKDIADRCCVALGMLRKPGRCLPSHYSNLSPKVSGKLSLSSWCYLWIVKLHLHNWEW